MIWPFRPASSSPPEARLWDHLDACAIPFRSPLSDWVSQMHLTPAVWNDGLDYCIPNATSPLIAGLDAPMRAQVSDYTDLDAPPDYLWGAVRAAADHRLNYAKGIAGLTKLFGKGTEASSSNTVAREWRFGLARVRCTVWPPALQNTGPNARHQLFPETIEEASIAIHPAWRPPLGEAEHRACTTAKMLWADPEPRNQATLICRSRDWPKAVPPLPQGVAISSENDVLVIRARGICDIHPAGSLKALKLDRLTPAKGGSSAYLSAVRHVNCRDGLVDQPREIAAMGGRYDGLDALAEDLASRLALPLDVWTGANV